MSYIEKEITIAEVKELLQKNKKIKIDSPDGWQEIVDYGEMGEKQTYIIKVNGIETIVAENHLIETNKGWVAAKKIKNGDLILTREGYFPATIKINDIRDVVDITVNHPNHRYYSNNISSHNCHYAAEMSSQGYSVLYVTMEMAAEKIALRIDANLFDKTMDQVQNMEFDEFMGSIDKVKNNGFGKIVVEEFPTAGAHMGHVEALLRDLKNKKGFVPDIVCLDYLNICLSRRISLSQGTYLFVKAIAEEFRGLAVKYNFGGVTATQGNRSTIESNDIGLQDTGESKGINDTMDFILAMMSPEEYAKQGIMLCKQLKSRYDDVNKIKRFALSFDRSKMYFEETENPEQFVSGNDAKEVIDDSKSLFDRSTDNRFLTEGDKAKEILGEINWGNE